MKYVFKANTVAKHAANIFYPALSEEYRSYHSSSDFEYEVQQLLIELGDMEDERFATEQGEKNGIKNERAGRYEYESNDEGQIRLSMHSSYISAFPRKEGEEYLRRVIKKYYPGFSDEVYLSHREAMRERRHASMKR